MESEVYVSCVWLYHAGKIPTKGAGCMWHTSKSAVCEPCQFALFLLELHHTVPLAKGFNIQFQKLLEEPHACAVSTGKGMDLVYCEF